jgi:hypothetical protein
MGMHEAAKQSLTSRLRADLGLWLQTMHQQAFNKQPARLLLLQ